MKAIQDIVKITIVFSLLWACGYISLKQLLLIYLILMLGIILSAIKPAISSIYGVPSEWCGLKPAMILFNKFSEENSDKLELLDEDELEKTIRTYVSASKIISSQLLISDELLHKYPEILKVHQAIDGGIKSTKTIHKIKKQSRKRKENAQKQKKEIYLQNVVQERKKRGLNSGVPPVTSHRCPLEYPIRATDKTKELGVRGIYYFPDELQGVEVYWCFANSKEAESENFRRPRRTPPKRQPK